MRPPVWTRDEVILVLDLYLRSDRRVLGSEHPDVRELSSFLRRLRLSILPGDQLPDKFRSPGSVELKLANVRSHDPLTESVGMQRGSKIDREIWEEFADDPEGIESEVRRIRNSV